MKSPALFLVIAVVAAVVIVIALKPTRERAAANSTAIPTATATTTSTNSSTAATTAALPRLLDLGAGKCIPCKMMVPILADLTTTYAGSLRVEFIDVWENKEAAQAHAISTIPTQIFFAPDGKELFRHEGFFAKEDILAQWKTLGYELKPASQAPVSALPGPQADAAITNGTTCPSGVQTPVFTTIEDLPPKRKCCGGSP